MCGIPRWAILHSMWGRVQDAHSQHSKTHTTQQDHDNWTHTTGYVTHNGVKHAGFHWQFICAHCFHILLQAIWHSLSSYPCTQCGKDAKTTMNIDQLFKQSLELSTITLNMLVIVYSSYIHMHTHTAVSSISLALKIAKLCGCTTGMCI